MLILRGMMSKTSSGRIVRIIAVFLVLGLAAGPQASARRFLDDSSKLLEVQATNLVHPGTTRLEKCGSIKGQVHTLPCESAFTALDFQNTGTGILLEWTPLPSTSFAFHLDRLRSPPRFV
jgi:hypothetical protein